MHLKLPAPAKINLHLKVTGTLPDGYHTLDTSFVYIDAYDELSIKPFDTLHVTCSNPTLQGENNLVYRLLKAFREQHEIRSGLSIHVEKRLPEQAGLGGGSSDAATALLAANRLWGIHAGTAELIDFSAPFGADIPCFLFGQASLATGIGEQLIPLPGNLPTDTILLAHPGIGLSTPEVFKTYDAMHGQDALTRQPRADTIRAPDGGSRNAQVPIGENDLEPVACRMSEKLDVLLQAMRKTSLQAWMSGSGTACVARLASEANAAKLAENLRSQKLASWIHIGQLMPRHPLADMWD